MRTYLCDMKIKSTYVNVGRSLYWARKRMNLVKKGSVWLVVPMAIALAMVPTIAMSLRIKSNMARILFTAVVLLANGDELILVCSFRSSTWLICFMFLCKSFWDVLLGNKEEINKL